MTLALIPIAVRFWLRHKDPQRQPWTRNLSDGLVVLSWLSGVVLISINTWKNSLRERYVGWPAGALYYSVPRPQSAHLLYVSWVSLFFIYVSLWAAKFALLAFYASLLRLMDTRAARAMLAVTTAFAVATFALHMALLAGWCRPVSANWDIEGELCSAVHDIRSVTVSTAANIATDLAIVALPLFALASLSRERRLDLTTVVVDGGAEDDGNSRDISLHDTDGGGASGSGTAASRNRESGGRSRGGGGRGGRRHRRWRVTRAEVSALVFVLCMAALSITAALTRWITLWLVQGVPKANITHTIDVWALVEIVASLLAVCLPSLRTLGRRGRRRAAGASGWPGGEGGGRGGEDGLVRRPEKPYSALESGATASTGRSRGELSGYEL